MNTQVKRYYDEIILIKLECYVLTIIYNVKNIIYF